jgi:cation:H+ antiporter
MIGATVIFIGLAFRGTFDMLAGGLLLGMLAFVLADAFREARNHRRACAAAALDPDDEEEVEGADPNMPWWQIYVFLVLGLAGLPLGADLLVDNASIIARRYGVSDSVIGLTLVALGTSLPELATTVMAALRRQADVALGNVIGSNLFNLLAIIGITTMIGEIPVDPEFLQFDLWVMLGASLLLGPFVLMKMDINRIWGIVLTALYLVYVTFILT